MNILSTIDEDALRPIVERLVKPMLDRKDVALASFEKVGASLSARLDKIEGPYAGNDQRRLTPEDVRGRFVQFELTDRLLEQRLAALERIMATRATRKPRAAPKRVVKAKTATAAASGSRPTRRRAAPSARRAAKRSGK